MIEKNVLIGKDNWLFLWSGGQNQFDYLRGLLEVDQQSIENFTSNITLRKKYLSTRGIQYKHVVFPSKPLLKRKHIPKEYSNIQSLFEKYYQKNCSEISGDIIYPLERLVHTEKNHSTFHKLNTHNSDVGYYQISTEILNNLEIETISLEEIPSMNLQVSGDLAKMLNSPDKSTESFLKLPFDMSESFTIGNQEFLPGNTNDVLISFNAQSLTTKRALIFGDSFFKGTIKFLKPYFKDILYIRSQHIHKEIIEGFSPDIVLSGNAERYLNKVESDSAASNFIMKLYGNKLYNPSASYIKALDAQLSFAFYPNTYKNWVASIKESFSLKDFQSLSERITTHSQPADILREVALCFEKAQDVDTAYKVMKQALQLRPNGPFIIKKVNELSKKLGI